MKFLIISTFLAVILLAAATQAEETKRDCGDKEKDGSVTAWFKDAGCSIKDFSDKAVVEAKKLGHSVSETYGDVKEKLVGDKKPEDGQAAPVHTPTEKVPLAPLPNTPTHNTGEHVPAAIEPDSIDDRFLFQNSGCPKGQVYDHNDRCRPAV